MKRRESRRPRQGAGSLSDPQLPGHKVSTKPNTLAGQSRLVGSPYADAHILYRQRGWPGSLPVPARCKAPPPKGYTGHGAPYPSGADAYEWAIDPTLASANIAQRMPTTVIGLDVDAYSGKSGAATIAEARRRWGALPLGPWSSARLDGSGIRFYRVPAGTVLVGVLGFPALDIGCVEIIQAHHRYAVVWPSVHPNGNVYRWRDGDGRVLALPPRVTDLPALPPSWRRALAGRIASVESASGEQRSAFLAGLAGGQPCQAVMSRTQRAVAALGNPAGARHDVMCSAVLALLRLAEQGHRGVPAALDHLRRRFVATVTADGSRTVASAHAEFVRMRDGQHGIGLILATPTPAGQWGCRCRVEATLASATRGTRVPA